LVHINVYVHDREDSSKLIHYQNDL